ncbi:NmrA family NAD(P)-binding protein [Microbacterium invictum]|uniref:NmrA family NAD(P)-binding protein n=1 Tax=Microbacterium invictum TaxID=515415 RepID=A0ABZ0VA93_9MICO|nr:NmrA family NAD(P)-binding protein [Microbacterium invictum]WQB70543.1 NmrA family NAD(P)-binding protein [Microbacterium invictum]
MNKLVAVTGATGDVGGKTTKLLNEAGVPVRVIVRKQKQANEFAEMGVDARVADLDDPAALTRALEGVDQLFLVVAATERQAEHGANAVAAARDAGVRAIVHLSSADAVEDSPLPWGRAIWRVNELVRSSGLEYTLLHASGFMTNFEASAPAIRRGIFPQTIGRGQVPWIDTPDIARVASQILQDGTHEGAEPILTGPELLDGRGIARELAAGVGRRVRYIHLPSRVFAVILRATGVSAWKAEGLRQQFGRVARRGLDGVATQTNDVERLTGRAPRSLADWARSNRAALLG